MLLPLLMLIQGQGDPCCVPSMAAFVDDPAFIALHPSPLPLDFAPAEGKAVEFPATSGPAAKGFYVPGKGAGIVIVHEWWA